MSKRTYLSVSKTCERLGGCGRTYLYSLIAAGRVESIKLGGKRLIVEQSLDSLPERNA